MINEIQENPFAARIFIVYVRQSMREKKNRQEAAVAPNRMRNSIEFETTNANRMHATFRKRIFFRKGLHKYIEECSEHKSHFNNGFTYILAFILQSQMNSITNVYLGCYGILGPFRYVNGIA